MSHSFLLQLDQIVFETTLSRATIYRMMKRGEFPQRVQISPRRVGWRSADIRNWLDSRK